jgi:3-dehydroquinate synthase
LRAVDALRLDLGERSYDILIGRGLIDDAEHLGQAIAGGQCCIVTNETIAPLYLDRLRSAIPAEKRVDVCVIPDGEQYKSLDTYGRIMNHLLESRHSRHTTLIALGGGVVGDITGFVAATYQRGVGFIQVPTTLLAQVDSSVGGKTAVNHPLGKNMIGAFYQPRLVLADIEILDTLPQREYLAGIAEVIKYGIIRDTAFFDWLGLHREALLAKEDEALRVAVKTSCALKAEIVAADEREADVRAILNYGHTFAHAIETLTGYAYLHGEAVAIGMTLAADLSARLGHLAWADAGRIRNLIEGFGLASELPGNLAADAMIDVMRLDKKSVDGRLKFVVGRAIGRVETFDLDDLNPLKKTLEAGQRVCRV